MIYIFSLLFWILVFVLIYGFAMYSLFKIKVIEKPKYEIEDYIVFISNDWSSLYS